MYRYICREKQYHDRRFAIITLGLMPCEGVCRLVAARVDPQHPLTGNLAEVADRRAIEKAVSRKDEIWKRRTRWKPKLRNRFVTMEPSLDSKVIRKPCIVIGLASHVEDSGCKIRSK
jgi:hypothetical protein